MDKPTSDEYNPFFKNYIDLVPSGDLVSMMDENLDKIISFFKSIPKDFGDYKYASGKWSIKELLAHIIDSERVFAYRALVCIRMDDTILLPSMNENLYVENRDVSNIELDSLIEEFEFARKNTIKLYEGISENQYNFKAKSEGGDITAKALGFAIIGHTIHHKNVIKERYKYHKND